MQMPRVGPGTVIGLLATYQLHRFVHHLPTDLVATCKTALQSDVLV